MLLFCYNLKESQTYVMHLSGPCPILIFKILPLLSQPLGQFLPITRHREFVIGMFVQLFDELEEIVKCLVRLRI